MIEELKKMKYYVLTVAAAAGIYTWANLTGTRLLGDDEDKTETHAAFGGRSFYHK